MANARDEGRIADMTEAMQAALASGGGLGGTLNIKVDPASLIPLLAAQTTAILDSISGIGAVDNTAAFAQIRSDIAAIPQPNIQSMLDTLKTQIVSAIQPVSLAQVNAKLDAILAALDVTPPPPPVNVPPTVTLSMSILASTAPGAVMLIASPADSDGTVVKVELERNGALVPGATKLSSPYTFTDTGLAAGTYSYAFRAYDDDGLSTLSAVSTATINQEIINPNPEVPIVVTPI